MEDRFRFIEKTDQELVDVVKKDPRVEQLNFILGLVAICTPEGRELVRRMMDEKVKR